MNPDENGLLQAASPRSVSATLMKLRTILEAHGVKIFTTIDHSGEAERAGFKMRPTQLLIFCSPKSGTPLMLAAPTSAIDLPLKALVWEDSSGKVWISYNSPSYLKQRHNIPDDLIANIAGIGALIEKAIE